jgi:hypothetical protein
MGQRPGKETDVDVKWVQIRSYHAIRTWTRVPRQYITYCGRSASGREFDDLPAGKSCELCLRAVARQVDA